MDDKHDFESESPSGASTIEQNDKMNNIPRVLCTEQLFIYSSYESVVHFLLPIWLAEANRAAEPWSSG